MRLPPLRTLGKKKETRLTLRQWAPIVAVAILIGTGLTALHSWWLFRAPPDARLSCAWGYAGARDARDTAKVDRSEVRTPADWRPVNCGLLRRLDSIVARPELEDRRGH